MARGRMITNQICRDKKIHELSDDTSRLAFTWLITFADVDGRVPGDPAIVRSMVFPRRDDVTVKEMDTYIQEWHDAGLIVRYEANDDLYIWFPAFEKNQPGMRKDREPESIIPPPPSEPDYNTPQQPSEPLPDDCRQTAGSVPDEIPVKLREEKLIKENLGAKTAPKEPKTKKEPSAQDLAYYNLQDLFTGFTGLPKPTPKSQADYREFNTLWMSPGKSILSWVEYDQNKAGILVEESVKRMQKDNLTIANFKSIVKVASDSFSKRNSNNGHQ